VANGGLKTLPDLGRQAYPVLGKSAPLVSSLVALDLVSGTLKKQWRLSDSYLSLRHVAYHAGLNAVGVALQAHHPDALIQQQAPVFAVLNAQQDLVCSPEGLMLQGYGGSVACTPQGFLVSSPLSNKVVEFDGHAQCVRQFAVQEPCALACGMEHVWVGGKAASDSGANMALDNHWVVQPLVGLLRHRSLG
jgi:hypothetical protein